MANRKISELTALTTPDAADYLPIVDVSEPTLAARNKRITILELLRGAPNGTAAAPAFAFEGDDNTGLYSPGADQVALATGGTGRLIIDTSGRLLVGTSSARSNFVGGSYSSLLQVERSGDSTRRLCASFTYGNTDAGAPFISFAKHRGGGIGEQTVVQSGDSLGATLFHGSDGTNFILGAGISAEVDGTPGANDMPGRLVFSTTADGQSTPTERMRIDSTGLITIAGPGIKFPAAQVASADPNTLDDYEEGTWTPVISNTGFTYTYSNQTGTYTKVGRRVTLSWRVAVTARSGSASGGLPIVAIPLAASSSFTGSATMAPQPAQLVIHKAATENTGGIRTFLYSGLANSNTSYFWIGAVATNGDPFDIGSDFHMGGVFTYEV